MVKIKTMADGSVKIILPRGCQSDEKAYFTPEWEKGPEKWCDVYFVKNGALYSSYRVGCDKQIGDYLYDVSGLNIEEIVIKLQNKDFEDYRKHDSKARNYGWIPKSERTPIIRRLDIEFDGRNIVELMKEYPKMNYWELTQLLACDKATVDSDGIIHKSE